MTDAANTAAPNTENPKTIVVTPPAPPRLTGNAQADMVALANWADQFYAATVRAGYFLNVNEESNAEQLDPGSLPDPATATVATAQQTANTALTLATSAASEANRTDNWLSGQVTITGAATSAAVAFPAEKAQPDTNYKVLVSVAASSGSPALGGFVPSAITAQTINGFTLNVQAAPGGATSVTFNYLVMRNI